MTSALEAAKKYCVAYAKGYHAETESADEELVQEAVKAAKQADVAVVFAGLPDSFESEGFDREHDQLPDNQNRLIEEISEVQKNLVVVLHGGSPMHLPWLKKVKAVLCMHLEDSRLEPQRSVCYMDRTIRAESWQRHGQKNCRIPRLI